LAGFLASALLVYIFGVASFFQVLIWIGIGAAVGWLGSLVMASDTQSAILLDILAGSVGALFGLLLFGGSVSEGSALERFLSSIVGSVALITLTAAARRAMRRKSTTSHEIS
jgi:uncharacterized membrane protein YeaQ/YmgE (transglycosylase-associated protein family)